MLRRSICLLIALACLTGGGAGAASGQQGGVSESRLALLNRHCQKCHGEKTSEASFRVDTLPLTISNAESAQRWQKVLNSLNSGEMPPPDEPAIDQAAKADLLDELSHALVAARKQLGDLNLRKSMRRLNRREYRNSLRELLGVEVNVNELPADTSNGHFDTVGSNLFMSGTQFEQYLSLGRKALDEAFERETAADVERKFRVEGEEITPKVAQLIENQLDAQKRARTWCDLVDKAAGLPENAGIVADIRAGPLGSHRHIFYRSWKRFPGVPAPETFGFKTVENNADKAVAALTPSHLPYHRYYLEQPGIETGAFLAAPNEHPAVLDNATINLLVPFNWPAGDYVVRFQAAATEGVDPDRRFIEFGINPRVQEAMSAHEITGTMDNPQIVEIPLTLTRDNRDRANRSLFLREKGTRDNWPQAVRVADEGRKANQGIGRTFALWVDWMEIERAPANDRPQAPGLAVIIQLIKEETTPVPTDKLRIALEAFAVEAFRGTRPSAEYIDRLVAYYGEACRGGEKPVEVLKETVAIILSSPEFLYLAEPNESGSSQPLEGLELAIRLSFLLWSAPPDAALRQLAEKGELNDPAVLAAQADRLLDDPRSDAFVRGFTYQWLGLERLDFFQVNQERHRRFDNSTRQAVRLEVYETVGHLLRSNGSLTDLLEADYVVVNGLLANYYGLEGVHGDAFRKVHVPAGSPRGGLLGMAAVHLMGSNGDGSNPVERGAWVLRKLLNDPPPPAPANVPQLARLSGRSLTTRERLLAHQEEPQCANCHRKIDPIGFGLENFDAVGGWRTEDTFQAVDDSGKPIPNTKKTWTIDPAGALYRGRSFHDYFELRSIIADHRPQFARGFSESLIAYALGRPCGFRDEPSIETMLADGASGQFQIRSLIHSLIRSREFHTK